MNNNRLLITSSLYGDKFSITYHQNCKIKSQDMTTEKKEIRTQIIIKASTAAVWSVLTNNENYENWNPFIVKSEGKIELGKHIKNTLKNGNKNMVFKPKITDYTPETLFGWKGNLLIPGVFDGYHVFELHKISDMETKLIHHESFSGILSGLILNQIRTETEAGFVAMNKALKAKAEQ